MEVLNYYKIGRIIPENAEYIGRENKNFNLKESIFANPFPLNYNEKDPEKKKEDRKKVLEQYKQWLWKKMIREEITKDQLMMLDGKNLVCYCAPLECHGNVIVSAIKWIKANPLALEEAINKYKEEQKEKVEANNNIKYVSRRRLS